MGGKTNSSGPLRGLSFAAALLAGRGRQWIPTLAVLALTIWGLNFAWQKWGVPASRSSAYSLTAEQIQIPARPAWIHTDVKAEVIRDAQLERLLLLDPKLTEKISRAFSLHTWVARVKKVRKEYPSRVMVDLEYRQPVGMVEVETEGPGLLFVDRDSVLLPSDDFALKQTQNYLRIHAPRASPAGPYGTLWGDVRIAGAAKIAYELRDDWQKTELKRINAKEMPGGKVIYELETKEGKTTLWGRAPGDEAEGEPTAEMKRSRLLTAFPELPTALDEKAP